MKVFFWIYAVVGTIYFIIYSAGVEVVVRYSADWLNWLMMMVAPFILGLLVLLPLAQRLGLLKN